MEINNWFTEGCNYEQGLVIYASLKKSNQNLLRLFKKNYSKLNHEKLRYELSKFKHLTVSTSTPLPTAVPPPTVNEVTVVPVPVKQYRPLLINQLPVELHPVYIKQKTDFATACSLKMQLNHLTADQEAEALKLCIEIESLFDAIEHAWRIIDHYQDHKTILQLTTNDFDALSPSQLLQRRNLKRASISKIKKQLSQLDLAAKKDNSLAWVKKIAQKREKLTEKQLQLETDVTQLQELIDKK